MGLAIPKATGIPAPEGVNACRADSHLTSAQELWTVLEQMFLLGFLLHCQLATTTAGEHCPLPRCPPVLNQLYERREKEERRDRSAQVPQ